MTVTRRSFATLPLVAALSKQTWAQPALPPIRIGVLNDQSGVFSDSTGAGSTLSAQLAAEDMAGGRPIEIIAADHQNKADVGASIAREWFDKGGVHAIADLGNSAVALAVKNLARDKNKVCLISAGGTTALTGAQCSPNTVQWTFDTYSQATSLAEALCRAGKNKWFFVTVDYTFGHSLQEEATQALKRLGGSVVGSTRHPLATSDFSSYLLQAQASGADVIAFANGGDDTGQCAKQAREFGLTARQTLVGLSMLITDVHAIGLEAAQGLLVSETFYWDLNDRTRTFGRRWSTANRDRAPTMLQAGVYGAVLHYLKAVRAGADPQDGAAVVRRMKAMPTDDDAFGAGTIRIDGRKIHDSYVFRAKQPAESKGSWDDYAVVNRIPGKDVFRSLEAGGCPLLDQMSRG